MALKQLKFNNIMKSLELDILWIPAEEVELLNLGIETSGAPQTQPITFYRIENIQPQQSEGKEECVIVSGGREYISTKSYKEVKQLIEDNL